MEHLICRKVPQSIILSGVVGTDVSSLRTFLEVLSGNGQEYDSDDIDYNAPPRMCYHNDSKAQPKEALGLMAPDQSPRSYAAYLQEKVDRLRAR